jgi:hypothetical protein
MFFYKNYQRFKSNEIGTAMSLTCVREYFVKYRLFYFFYYLLHFYFQKNVLPFRMDKCCYLAIILSIYIIKFAFHLRHHSFFFILSF